MIDMAPLPYLIKLAVFMSLEEVLCLQIGRAHV